MESDIGNPIEYNPVLQEVPEEKDESNEKHSEEYYFHPSDYPPPQQPYQGQESFDLVKNVDKSTWIIAFAVFLLGFFMGKTMQPVILRYT